MSSLLHLDFETFSKADLRNVGAYKYAEDPSTEILCAAWALDDGPIQQWEPHLNPRPPRSLVSALSDDDVLVVAHNAEFERRILVKCMDVKLPRARYRCTAVRAAAAGLPRALDGALSAIGHVVRKDPRGKAVLRKFSRPRKPTKKLDAVRLLPHHDPDAWQVLLDYNKQDIVAEKALDDYLPDLTPREWRYYFYTCKMNDRGLPLDVPTLKNAAKVVKKLELASARRVLALTRGIAPTQVGKLLIWLNSKGADLPNLQLKTIQTKLRDGGIPDAVREVLSLRLEASRASTKKIKAMLDVVCEDGRAHGTVLSYGAHTGRLTGRLIQPLNYPRGLLDNKKTQGARQNQVLELFGTGDHELCNMLLWHQPDDKASGRPPIEGPMSMLAQSMRGFIKAPNGYEFYIADYASIEARILAWVANETKLLIAFRNKVDTYKMMASVLYGIPVEDINDEQRRIGKNLRLGAGYQLGPPRLIEHCEKEEIFITLEFARKAIKAFRDESRNTVHLWYDIEDAAIQAVQTGRQTSIADGKVRFETWRDWLLMILPSGRKMHYYKPVVETVIKFRKPKLQLSYFGERKKGIKGNISTYGGKLTENWVQGVARDIMMIGMENGERLGYEALINIYDEDLTLRKIGEGSVEELEKALCKMPSWANGIPLAAEGFKCERYRKG